MSSSSPGPLHSIAKKLRTRLRVHAEWIWAPLLYSLAVVYLYRALWDGQQGFGWDTIEAYWPDVAFLGDEMREGNWPRWNPYSSGGYPIYADPQAGLHSPIQWLFAGLTALVPDSSWSIFQFKMLFHHVMAGLCMHAFLRHRNLPRLAAIVGGIALIASTPFLIHKASNLLHPMVWTPLLWIATDRLLTKPNWRTSAALAAALYLAGSAGSPPGFFYVLLMAGLYGAYRVVEHSLVERSEGRLRTSLTTTSLWIAAAAILAIALLWIDLAPALELTKHTPRQNRNLAYALSFPLPLWPSLRGILVATAGQVDSYVGVLALLLALAGLVISPRQDRGAPIAFAVAAIFFFSLSVGKHLPVLPWLVTHLPGFGLFRASNRYKCLFAPMLAVCAGYGVSALLQAPALRGRKAWIFGAVVALFLALILYQLGAHPVPKALLKRFPDWKTPLTLSVLACGLVLAAAWHRPRAKIYLIAIMPLFLLSDPEHFWHHQQSFLEKRVNHKEDLQVLAPLDGVLDHRYRIYDEFALEQKSGSRLRVRDFRGYPSGDPLDLRRYRDILKKAAKHPELLEAFNVKYMLYANHHRSGKRSHRIKGDPSRTSPAHFKRGAGPVREALHPVAIVAWYGKALRKPTAVVLDAILQSEGQDGKRDAVIVEPAPWDSLPPGLAQSLQSSEHASVAGRLQSFSTDKVVVQIDAPTEGIVVLNEVNYPGWTALVDGKPTPVFTANYLLRAVAVSAGPHTIEWRFEPVNHNARRIVYFLALLTLLAAALPKSLFAKTRAAKP